MTDKLHAHPLFKQMVARKLQGVKYLHAQIKQGTDPSIRDRISRVGDEIRLDSEHSARIARDLKISNPRDVTIAAQRHPDVSAAVDALSRDQDTLRQRRKMRIVKAESLIEEVLNGTPASIVFEAVDHLDHAHSVFRHYGYAPDPRHGKEDPKHRWYVHESGHQGFVYFDPTNGMVWNLYQSNPRQEALTGDQYTFGKGFGVNSLEMKLDLLHNQLAG